MSGNTLFDNRIQRHALFLAGLAAFSLPARAAEPKFSFEKHAAPVLAKYCIDCHSGDAAEAGIELDRYETNAQAAEAGAVWRKVYEMVESQVMPPDEPRPDLDETVALLGWIQQFAKAECEQGVSPGRVTVRRLNRTEYNNTVRDLLGVDATPADDFPADDVGYGFDNIGDVLSISPIHTEKYLAAAERLSEQAIYVPDTQTLNFESSQLSGGSEQSGYRALPSVGEVHCEFDAPRVGDYVLVAVAYGQQAGDDPVRMEFKLDDESLKTVDVPAERAKPGTYKIEAKLPKGKRKFAVRFTNDYYRPDDPDPNNRDRNMYVVSLSVVGPTNVPPDAITESHRRLIFVHPDSDDLSPQKCAEKILERFVTRAYRRPVTPEEMQRLVALANFAWERDEPFERGIQLCVQAVLSSPHFLLRVERDAPGETGPIRKIDEYSLATRLSYFLWSTMPDAELFEHARNQTLRKNLEKQIRRMIKDPRSDALVENFASQWLHTRNLLEATPDKEEFPFFNEKLRLAMKKETELYFREVMREDRSVLDFLSSDYTFLNQTLAEHYGVNDVKGDEFRKVSLRNQRALERGGILTHASILTVTSNPNRTSPVKRGKWILEQILGTPPPPPPPDVEELSEEKSVTESASLRERLEAHRAKPECAGCHDRMDPLGFALENYDAVGRWREQDGRFPVDSSATLPDGRSFGGPSEMKALLKAKPQKFLQCLAEKMLTYAIGRGLEYTDHCVVDKIAEDLASNDYRFSRLILAVVESDPFQLRVTEGAE